MKLHHLLVGLILTSLAIVFLAVRAKSPGVIYQKLEYITPDQQRQVTASQVSAALSNAAEAEFAVVFFQYDWSLTSTISEIEYFKFVDEFCERRTVSPVLFHHVNLTSTSSLSSTFDKIPEWKTIMAKGDATRMLGQGDGLLVWMKAGQLVAMENAYELRNQDLSEKTTQLFGLGDKE